MNRNDFIKQLDRLTEVFSPLTTEAVEEYYKGFKFFELSEIEDAVGMLIIDHKGDFTPKPAELLGMINEMRRQSSNSMPGEDPPAPICEVCKGTGFKTWLVQGRLKATPCNKCARGQAIINAPRINKKPGYPGGWREAYQAHKPRLNTDFDSD
jgi:hypothetical protein